MNRMIKTITKYDVPIKDAINDQNNPRYQRSWIIFHINPTLQVVNNAKITGDFQSLMMIIYIDR